MRESPLTNPSANGTITTDSSGANTYQVERERLIDDLAFLVVRHHQYWQGQEKDIDVSSVCTNRGET